MLFLTHSRSIPNPSKSVEFASNPALTEFPLIAKHYRVCVFIVNSLQSVSTCEHIFISLYNLKQYPYNPLYTYMYIHMCIYIYMIGIIFFRQGQSQSQANLNFPLMTSLFGNYGELASADPSADWVVTFSLQNKEFGLGVGWVGGMNAKWCEVQTWIDLDRDISRWEGRWPQASKVHLSHMAIPKSQSRGKLVRLLSLGSSRSEPSCARNMYHVTYRFHLIDWVVSRPQELLIHWRTSYNYNMIYTYIHYIILYYIILYYII